MRKTVSGTNIHIFGPSKEALKERLTTSLHPASTHRPQTSWLSFGWAVRGAQHDTLTHLVSETTELAPVNIIAIPADTNVSELASDLIPAAPAASSANQFILVVMGNENAEKLAADLAAKYSITFEKFFQLADSEAALAALRAHLFPTMPAPAQAVPAAAPAPAAATAAAPSSPPRPGVIMGVTKPYVAPEVRAALLRTALTNYLNSQIARPELTASSKITELESIRTELKPELDVLGVQTLVARTRTLVSMHRNFMGWLLGPSKGLQAFDKIFDRTNNLISPDQHAATVAPASAPEAASSAAPAI